MFETDSRRAMAVTNVMTDAEREIANIRCLVAQQLQTIERHGEKGPERRAADILLRKLLRRDEDLRRRLIDTRPGAPNPPR